MHILSQFAIAVLSLASANAEAAEHHLLVMQSLTGPAAFVGEPARDGMLLAIEESNRNRELGTDTFLKASVADDGYDRAQAVPLLVRYAQDQRVLFVMGPTGGAAAVASAHAANDAKIAMMTMSSAPDVVRSGHWGFTTTMPPWILMPNLGKYAAEKLKLKTCTIISTNDNEAYNGQREVAASDFQARGIAVVGVELMRTSDTDVTAIVTKVASRKQDCVYLNLPAPQGANVAVQLRQAGLDPRVTILGSTGMSSPELIRLGGKAVEEIILMTDWIPGGLASDAAKSFDIEYRRRYGTEPGTWSAVGYSAMRVLIEAIKRAGPKPTRESVRAAMAKSKDIAVPIGDGKYSFDENGFPSYKTKFVIVRNGQFVPLP